jgi:hypothetical protein
VSWRSQPECDAVRECSRRGRCHKGELSTSPPRMARSFRLSAASSQVTLASNGRKELFHGTPNCLRGGCVEPCGHNKDANILLTSVATCNVSARYLPTFDFPPTISSELLPLNILRAIG